MDSEALHHAVDRKPAASTPTFSLRLAPIWILGGALIVGLAYGDFRLLTDGADHHPVVWGRDFVNVWTGGHLVRDGRVAVLFDLPAYARAQRGWFGALDPHNYSYPPISYPVAELLSLLPYWLALVVWQVATAALFLWAARPWWPRAAGPLWLALLTPAALVNIWAGHYGFVVGALFLGGWCNVDRRPYLAGILFGLMLIKPHLAVLVPLALLLRRDWRAIGSAATTVAVLILGTAALYGWQPWVGYLVKTRAVQAGMIDAGGTLFEKMSTSPATAVLGLRLGWAAALTVQAGTAALGIVLVVLAVRRGFATLPLAMLIATCTFLVLPYGFAYDMTVVCIGALWLLVDHRVKGADRWLAAVGFVGPQIGIALAALGLPVMPLMIAGLAIAQYRRGLFGGPMVTDRVVPTGAAAAHSA